MILSAIVFIFGLLIGSFLNAVIYRLHSGEGIVKARSHCVTCEHVLAWYELIPVFSFIFQRGRCRGCSQPIFWQYPLVELGTALIFVLIVSNSQFLISNEFLIPNIEFLNIIYYFAISSLLIVVFVFDLKHYIIPDKVVFPAIGLVFLYRVFEFLGFGIFLDKLGELEIRNLEALSNPLLSAILASAFFAAVFFVSKGKWLGFGDVKLVFFMGLLLGWPGILVALFITFILGGIIGLGLIVTGKKSMKSQVPFGPFLVAGTFSALFWGEEIMRWYLGLFV